MEDAGGGPGGAGRDYRGLINFLLDSLDEATVFRREERRVRHYIGASGIGSTCLAYQALSLRGFPSDEPDAKLQRIFDRGHQVEAEVLALLKSTGLSVVEADPATGGQWEVSGLGGHVVAHLDAKIENPLDPIASSPWVLEVKSMNKEMFVRFKKKGLALSHPEYYDQVTLQMGLARLSTALVIAYCKDNSEHWAEVIEYDGGLYAELIAYRAERAMFGEPRRKHAHRKSHECTGCLKRGACWGGADMAEVLGRTDCSSCAHAMPDVSVDGKQWFCTLHSARAAHRCADFKLFRVVPMELT